MKTVGGYRVRGGGYGCPLNLSVGDFTGKFVRYPSVHPFTLLVRNLSLFGPSLGSRLDGL